jgi:hypothetical protein
MPEVMASMYWVLLIVFRAKYFAWITYFASLNWKVGTIFIIIINQDQETEA